MTRLRLAPRGAPAAFALAPRGARARVDRLHRTHDIPQADRLETVRQLIAAIHTGIEQGAAMLALLTLDARHFAYYRQAALILGLLEFTQRGAARITPLGQRILATAERSPAERRLFAEAIQSARALKPFASFFAGEDVDPAELARRLVAMTGLSQSTAERRAHTLVRWRIYVLDPGVVANPGLELPDITAKLRRQIDEHNTYVRQETLRWLREQVDPTRLEHIVAELLTAMSYEDVQHRGGAFDGGVDVVAVHRPPAGRPIRVAVQVKRLTTSVKRGTIDELLGVLHRDRFGLGIIVTTASFSAQAKEVAIDQPLELIDGEELVRRLERHRVILKPGPYGELRPG